MYGRLSVDVFSNFLRFYIVVNDWDEVLFLVVLFRLIGRKRKLPGYVLSSVSGWCGQCLWVLYCLLKVVLFVLEA